MAYPIVTTSTKEYLPGVKALYNSFKKHCSNEFTFHVMDYDGSCDLDCNIIHQSDFPAKRLPTSRRFDKPLPAMYGRLLIPDLFDSDYSIFIDADAIILRDLEGMKLFFHLMDFYDSPCSGTRAWSHISKEVIGTKLDLYGMMASFILFNHKQWKEKDILTKCIKAMERNIQYPSVVQGVLQSVLIDDWQELPLQFQAHGGRQESIQWLKDNDPYILHFAGTNPWCEFPPGVNEYPHKTTMRSLWKEYT